MFLIKDDHADLVNLIYGKREDKYVIWKKVAKLVRRNKYTKIITIGDAWVYDSKYFLTVAY